MSDKKNKNVNSAVVEEEVQKPTRAEKKAAKKAAKERLKKVLAARKNGEKLIADNYNGTSMIQTVNLKKKFDDHEVLIGIDEHVDKGEVVVVIGPYGSGKSTFLRSLIHLEHIDNGIIEIEGKEIAHKENKSSKLHISTKERRKRLLNVMLKDSVSKIHPI